jgi:anti-anti-sigma factor
MTAVENQPNNGSLLIEGEIDERKRRLLVEIKDDVTSTQVPDLRKNLLQILDQYKTADWNTLYIDMRTARMIDSMGMNWLFAESMRLKDDKKKVVVRISSPAINRVIQFAGLDKLVTLKFRRRKQTR